MTKSIRIENADTSPYQAVVHVEQLEATGRWVRTGSPAALGHPTALYTGLIHSGQRLVVEELVVSKSAAG